MRNNTVVVVLLVTNFLPSFLTSFYLSLLFVKDSCQIFNNSKNTTKSLRNNFGIDYQMDEWTDGQTNGPTKKWPTEVYECPKNIQKHSK